MKLAELLDLSVVQRLAEANYKANGMPIGILDAADDSILVEYGWQDICTKFHRANPETAARCRESDGFIRNHLEKGKACAYRCRNGLTDIGVPIIVAGEHLATLFLGQFFPEGEPLDRELFLRQAREVGFDEAEYLAALDRVPRFSREAVEHIIAYDQALARFIEDLAERALERARVEEQLREQDRRKNEFIGILSHELRNPLTPIRSAHQLLERVAPDSEQAAKARAVIGRQVEHLNRLVDDLLDVTRISSGKFHLKRRRLDLVELARRTVDDHRPTFAARGISLALEAPPAPVWVDGDPTRLSQALGNLLQNACKFTPGGGHVVAAVERAGREAQLRVRDDGLGISPTLLHALFEPFVQADRTLHRTQGGLGLGLALVRGIAELHGGTARARSDGEGCGAEFVLRIPAAEVAEAPAAPATDPPPAGRLRILIVEDYEDAAAMLRDCLELDGHEVQVAADGPGGVEAALATRPDLVLCDIGLPGFDGYEVARRLREAGSTTPLVALTGYASPEDADRAREAGFNLHLAKPPSMDQLARALAEAAPTCSDARGDPPPPARCACSPP